MLIVPPMLHSEIVLRKCTRYERRHSISIQTALPALSIDDANPTIGPGMSPMIWVPWGSSCLPGHQRAPIGSKINGSETITRPGAITRSGPCSEPETSNGPKATDGPETTNRPKTMYRRKTTDGPETTNGTGNASTPSQRSSTTDGPALSSTQDARFGLCTDSPRHGLGARRKSYLAWPRNLACGEVHAPSRPPTDNSRTVDEVHTSQALASPRRIHTHPLPPRQNVTAAELFYLHHLRSCSIGARGSRTSCSSPSQLDPCLGAPLWATGILSRLSHMLFCAFYVGTIIVTFCTRLGYGLARAFVTSSRCSIRYGINAFCTFYVFVNSMPRELAIWLMLAPACHSCGAHAPPIDHTATLLCTWAISSQCPRILSMLFAGIAPVYMQFSICPQALIQSATDRVIRRLCHGLCKASQELASYVDVQSARHGYSRSFDRPVFLAACHVLFNAGAHDLSHSACAIVAVLLIALDFHIDPLRCRLLSAFIAWHMCPPTVPSQTCFVIASLLFPSFPALSSTGAPSSPSNHGDSWRRTRSTPRRSSDGRPPPTTSPPRRCMSSSFELMRISTPPHNSDTAPQRLDSDMPALGSSPDANLPTGLPLSQHSFASAASSAPNQCLSPMQNTLMQEISQASRSPSTGMQQHRTTATPASQPSSWHTAASHSSTHHIPCQATARTYAGPNVTAHPPAFAQDLGHAAPPPSPSLASSRPNTRQHVTFQDPSAQGGQAPVAATRATPYDDHRSATGSRQARVFCPVAGCPRANCSHDAGFANHASMRPHLNEHCWGARAGDVPQDYLTEQHLTHCQYCNGLIHERYNGLCPSCKPLDRARRQVESLRTRLNAATQQSIADQAEVRPRTPSLKEIHSRYVPVRKHIPKELRSLWARCLARTTALTVWHNDLETWSAQQMLTKCTLCVSPRAGKSHKNQMTAWTRSRLKRWLAGERAELWHDLPNYIAPRPKRASPAAQESKRHDRCVKLVQEGGLSAACKALTKDGPLRHDAAIRDQLQEKHPANPSPPDLAELGASRPNLAALPDAEAVERAIRSFHRLSSAGPSCLRPVHLQEGLQTEIRDELLEHSAALICLMVQGKAPRELAPFLAGANLTALPKKDGSARPIAVGEVWRRLAAKTLCYQVQEAAASYLFPLQIGVAQPLGTEIGLHTARQWCERNGRCPSSVFLKIDFTNAFNTVDRQTFLRECRSRFPSLSPWVEWCYADPSTLFFGNHTISSESGVQQGDPLGPLLFALALQPVLQQLHATCAPGGLQLVFSYLDDCCLAGEYHAVAAAHATLQAAAGQIGLQLNTQKCELIPPAGLHHTIDRSLFPSDMIFCANACFELLGGPIGTEEFCNSHTQHRVEKATRLLEQLGELPDPQVALLLLRHCASFGKLVYSTRVVPHTAHRQALANFDSAIRDSFESFMSCSLSEDSWTLCTLSTQQGGLGLRSCVRHSPAAFLASTAACHSLCHQLDPSYQTDFADAFSAPAAALTTFNREVAPDHCLDSNDLIEISHLHDRQGSSTPSPTEDCKPKLPRQRELSDRLDDHTLKRLKQTATDAQDWSTRAHLELTGAPSAGQWLHTLPSPTFRNNVSPALYKVMIQRWVRDQLYDEEFTCPLCDGVVDVYGDHCLVCSGGGDRTRRHNLLRNAVFHHCVGANLRPELEKPGLLQPRPLQGSTPENGISPPSDARRPADVFLPRWRAGLPAALDFAATSGLRHDIVRASAQDASSATSAYEAFKRSHHNTEADCAAEGLGFFPVVVESSGGGWGGSALKVFAEIAKSKSSVTGVSANKSLAELLQSLGVILHRENARAIMRRGSEYVSPSQASLLSAAAVLQAPP